MVLMTVVVVALWVRANVLERPSTSYRSDNVSELALEAI